MPATHPLANLDPSRAEPAFKIIRRINFAGNLSACRADTDGLPLAVKMLREGSEDEAMALLYTMIRAARADQEKETRDELRRATS